MTLLWCESFEGYEANIRSLLDGGWEETEDSTGVSSLVTTPVRTGTNSLHFVYYVGSAFDFIRSVPSAPSTIGTGFSFYVDALPSTANRLVMVDFRDNANVPNLSVLCQTTGDISVFKGDQSNGTTLTTTSAPSIKAGTWNHVEVQATFNGSTGSVEVRVNGVAVISLSGINTLSDASEVAGASGGAANCGYVGYPGRSNASGGAAWVDVYYDDIYTYDMLGSYNNDWIGDIKVHPLRPNADTAQADWTGSYTDIDDSTVDDEDTYVSAGAPGSPSELTSEFELENLPTTGGTIRAVVVSNRIRKDTAGAVDYQAGVVSSGVDGKGTTRALSPVYQRERDIFETDPNSGSPFTGTEVNNLKLQINRV